MDGILAFASDPAEETRRQPMWQRKWAFPAEYMLLPEFL